MKTPTLWQTRDGRILLIPLMETGHIENIIKGLHHGMFRARNDEVLNRYLTAFEEELAARGREER